MKRRSIAREINGWMIVMSIIAENMNNNGCEIVARVGSCKEKVEELNRKVERDRVAW